MKERDDVYLIGHYQRAIMTNHLRILLAVLVVMALNHTAARAQWSVSPDAAIYVYGCDSTEDYPYTISNTSGSSISYTVQEVTSSGTPTDYPWLSLSKTSGGPIATGHRDTLFITVDSPGTANTGYIKFTPTGGLPVLTRQINVRAFPDPPAADPLCDGLAVFQYSGDVNPWSYGSCGFDCTFIAAPSYPSPVGNNHHQGAVVNDPDAHNGKAFRIDTREDTSAAELLGGPSMF